MTFVIFGFGQHHVDLTRGWASTLGQDLKEASSKDSFRETVENHVKFAGSTVIPSRTVGHAFIREMQYFSYSEEYAVMVVEGTWTHVVFDHPTSPDGIASMSLPFCITVCKTPEDVWGTRVHISV